MKSGIYKLTFANGLYYIGKSVDVEKRWDEHRTALLRNKASAKMQSAYKEFGLPKAEVLIECHPDHLDLLEQYFITHDRPVLNTTKGNSITKEDWELLMRNRYALNMSTVDHIKLIEIYTETLKTITESLEQVRIEVDELKRKRTEEELNTELGKKLEHTSQELNRYRELYHQELEKPWWKKVF